MMRSGPAPHIGQRFGSSAAEPLASPESSALSHRLTSTSGVGASKLRQRASLAARLRLASSPKWRMRMNPEGTTWSRKRRKNSVAGSAMTFTSL